MEDLKSLLGEWRITCNEGNFVGIGSTRKVYRTGEFVIKIHLHPIGWAQSLNEQKLYKAMSEKGLSHLFAEVLYVDESICIQKYYQPTELRGNQSFGIDAEKDSEIIPAGYSEALSILDGEFDSFDLRDSDNYGLDDKGRLIFVDYGMTKNLYEEQWVPLAESGILPQIDFDICDACGQQKELRIYGEGDQDKRCYSCGKE